MRLTHWQEISYSTILGILVTVVSSAFWGKEHAHLVFFVSAVYGFFSYVSLVWCVENAGSLLWEEDEMPTEIRLWMHFAAPICPIAVVLVVVGGSIWAYLKYKYDMMRGRIKST